MRVSLLVAPVAGRALLDAAAALDEVAGMLWLPDHLAGGSHFAHRPWMDASVALGAVAGRTTSLQVGSLVASLVLRPAVHLALQASTFEQLFPSRFLLGVGAGRPTDAARLGVAWPPATARATAFLVEVAGLRAELDLLASAPPLIVAANGAASLRAVARYADGWVTLGKAFTSGDVKRHAVRNLSAVLNRLCRDAGRVVDRRLVLIDPQEDSPWASRAALEDCMGLWAAEGMTDLVVFEPEHYSGSHTTLAECLDLFAAAR